MTKQVLFQWKHYAHILRCYLPDSTMKTMARARYKREDRMRRLLRGFNRKMDEDFTKPLRTEGDQNAKHP